MKCLRPLGLVIVLVTLPFVVYSATLETTSRYSLEEHIRFSITQPQKNIIFPIKANISSEKIIDNHLGDNFEDISNISTRKARKFSKLSAKIPSTPSKLTLSNASIKSKTKPNSNLVTASPTIVKSTIIKNNSSLTLNNTHRITFVASKAPVKYRVTPQPTVPKDTTVSKAPTKFTKVAIKTVQRTTPRTKTKPTSKRIVTSNLSKSSSTTQKPKKKPTIHKIVTKWSDSPSEIKQNWYEEGVPYPNPNPEISSASPSISISSLSPVYPLSSTPTRVVDPLSGTSPSPQPEITSYSPNYSPDNAISGTPDLIDLIPQVPTEPNIAANTVQSEPTAPGNPLSIFKLDMAPDNLIGSTGAGSPCPSVHISSQVLGPLSRQGCSDLNLVINSHIHQNTATRSPVDTYDALGPSAIAEDELIGDAAADPLPEDILADPILSDPIAADPVAADAAQAAPAPGTGGSGGSGGSGGDGSNSRWQFPDLKHMFEALGYVWGGIRYLLSFLRNPYLYIIPFLLFFLLSFFKVIALFPWWIPVLILYASVKHMQNQPKNQVTFTKHIHKPIRHHDGWFWNHQTQQWQNVADFPLTKRIDVNSNIKMITHLPQVYKSGTNLRIWKKRKRS